MSNNDLEIAKGIVNNYHEANNIVVNQINWLLLSQSFFIVGTFTAYSQISHLLGIAISFFGLFIVLSVSLTLENTYCDLRRYKEKFDKFVEDKNCLQHLRPWVEGGLGTRNVYRMIVGIFIIMWLIIITIEI